MAGSKPAALPLGYSPMKRAYFALNFLKAQQAYEILFKPQEYLEPGVINKSLNRTKQSQHIHTFNPSLNKSLRQSIHGISSRKHIINNQNMFNA